MPTSDKSDAFSRLATLIEDIKIERYGKPLRAALHLCNDLADELDAARSAALPQEATPEMCIAGVEAMNKGTPTEGYANGIGRMPDIWKAMLAEAAKPTLTEALAAGGKIESITIRNAPASSVEPHDLRLATGMLEGYMRQAAAHPGDVETLIPAIGETLRRLVAHASAKLPCICPTCGDTIVRSSTPTVSK